MGSTHSFGKNVSKIWDTEWGYSSTNLAEGRGCGRRSSLKSRVDVDRAELLSSGCRVGTTWQDDGVDVKIQSRITDCLT